MLADVQSPTQAIATWSAHLREQLPAGSEAAEALEAIVRSARTQARIIGSLLELAQGAAKMQEREIDGPLLAGVKVLVVEDDDAARDLLLKVLRVAGAQACAVPNSSEALRRLEDWRPDIM